MARFGFIGRAFAVLPDGGLVHFAGRQEIEVERDLARGRVVDAADVPVFTVAVLAREDGVIAHFARDQVALGPVGGDGPDEFQFARMLGQALDEIGRHLDGRIDRQIQPQLLCQRRGEGDVLVAFQA